ncbi:MAG: carbohydrate ABC transporter permease [Phycisphaerae bacterium]|nr:carbohydrate ABC transporter permease [Phycisphaerae bacterium]
MTARPSRERVRLACGAVLRYLLMTVLAAAMFLPFIWMVCTAFKSSGEVEGAHFWPQLPKPENFKIILRLMPDPFTHRMVNVYLWKWIYNSLFVAGWVTALQVFTSSLAAYAFSRIRWKGRDKVFILYLATMMIPAMVLTIPRFQIMVSLNLVNTYRGLIVPMAFSAFGTFLLRQFMLGIPLSYDEAAEIDGAGHWRIFLDVVLPLARPGLITLAIFTFLMNYRNLLWPLVMIKSDYLRNVPIGLLTFQGQYGSQTELLMATTVICIIPLIIMFILLQKRLVRGIHLGGGVKE